VLKEIQNATRSFPDAYVRLAAFDSVRQVQVAAMLVHRPSTVRDYRLPSERQA
jgi:ribulose-bisphosphate carboxylase small chain